MILYMQWDNMNLGGIDILHGGSMAAFMNKKFSSALFIFLLICMTPKLSPLVPENVLAHISLFKTIFLVRG